jgi:hypothetical protein
VVDSLIRSRDGTSDPNEIGTYDIALDAAGSAHPKRWADWVRQTAALSELGSALRYQRSAVGAVDPVAAFTVHHVAYDIGAAPGGAALASSPIATLQRPPMDCFRTQVARVLEWSELREERISEVLAQIDNQFALWGTVVPLHTSRMKPVLELVDLAIQLVVSVEMRFKHEFGVWRPADLSAQVQPMISTPEHGAFPAGHAAQAYAAAAVLQALLQLPDNHPRAIQLQRIAARVSINRVIAGVHFPVDLMAGRVLGQALGDYVVARCRAARAGAAGNGQTFTYRTLPYDPALDASDFPTVSLAGDWAGYPADAPAAQALPAQPSLLLATMWNEAEQACVRNGYLRGTIVPANANAVAVQPPGV